MPGEDLSVRGLVHDLNNVFQTIQDAADLLEEDERWSAVAGTIQRSTEQVRVAPSADASTVAEPSSASSG